MAERERKSKPRKAKPVEDDEQKYDFWQLGMYLVSAIAIIFLMVIVSQFLSNASGGPSAWLYYAFGGAALVAGLFWLGGWLAARKA